MKLLAVRGKAWGSGGRDKVTHNRFIGFVLCLTSFTPTLLLGSLYFWYTNKTSLTLSQIAFLITLVAIGLTFIIILKLTLRYNKKNAHVNSITVKDLRLANADAFRFSFSYLIPLLGFINSELEVFITILIIYFFYCYYMLDNTAYYNPLLLFFGYTYYQIKSNEITFFLLSKKNMKGRARPIKVVELTPYMLIEI